MKIGVYIGRFQPFTNGHLKTLQVALEENNQVMVIVGRPVQNKKTAVKDPFSFYEIKKMIINSLDDEGIQKLETSFQEDRKTDKLWQYDIKRAVADKYGYKPQDIITLYGDKNDPSSYYLDKFPLWDAHYIPNTVGFHASDVRRIFFTSNHVQWQDHETVSAIPDWKQLSQMVPQGTLEILEDFPYDEWKALVKQLKEER